MSPRVSPLDSLALRRGARRGSVVIFVLGIILLTAFLLTRLMDRAAVELAAEGKAAKRADMRQEALSALEASLAVLADESAVRSGLHDPVEGWDRPLARLEYQPAAGYTVESVVADETGKLSLPGADEKIINDYLVAIGCPVTAQEVLVDGLLAWTRPGHLSLSGDADGITFASAMLPYVAPQRSLRSFEELRAIPEAREVFFDETGAWNELGRRFRSGASLFAFNASNANTAHPDVLRAQGVDEARVAAITSAREDEKSRSSSFYRSTTELAGAWGENATPPSLGTEAICLHVMVMVKYGSRDYRIDAWVRPAGASGQAAPGVRRQNPETEGTQIPVSVRNNPLKRLDYPFQILELREYDGT